MQGQTSSRDRATYPEIKDKIGEDPARFLDTRDPEGFGSDIGDTPELALAFARIRGIQSIDVLDKWFEVEQDLPQGPRRHVVSELSARKKELEDAEEQPANQTTDVTGELA